MSGDPTRVAWTWRHAVCASKLAPTTRHVLLTLSMFMNEFGESCHPSTADICRYSGLDKKTVLKHLAVARESGWIDVSSHGYRGQKWKRQEYAARWPERDLVAPCQPDDIGEGGGAVPPRSEAGKAVESAPKGGGTEGAKVVEHVHQDKTSPENIPNTSPVEREARERDPEDRKAVERAFDRIWRDWPPIAAGSRPNAIAAWAALSPGERDAAKACVRRWLAAWSAEGRKHTPALSTYLADKRWEGLPPPEAEPQPDLPAPPFGKVWGAVRMKVLIAGPTGQVPPMTFTQRQAVQAGTIDATALMLERRAKYGFPAVNRMHERAAFGQGITAAARFAALGEAMEPVRVGSALWVAWQRLHEAHGWPWLPDPGDQEWVYFPAGGPERLGEFEAAVRGEDDAGGREAAE